MMFKNATQKFSPSDLTYTIPVVRTRNKDSPATVKWRITKPHTPDQFGVLNFGPGETEKNISIEPRTHTKLMQEDFMLELFDPSSNASIGERKTTVVNVPNGGKTPWHILCFK